MKYLKLVIFI